ncbi:MAG: bifunctional phosphoribosylaminoimidazolecarboxamide formyltransferase/IMP cyclohydrolase, partial [Aliifodinibius sp.]|nr:bifunctional phosphoribosylaminoimidazolecarboxamide formyltransferase/IMP cyclohydrolase [Fodinibius sp.]NIV12788.1 bifunctional phosphoribosylaminoimidazolecarboxamide formyltransferase/IMP cyclohydrolase [Fodinibius sp.]NIY26514.1 bifunctional phosphoribosylaminoimidazolecarboxamide formyltransferase/IMP cyclohydrolase [Fodinibius sp.]
LQKKKNLRLLRLSADNCMWNHQEIKSVNGAYLIQETDNIEEDAKDWQVVTKKQP